MKELKRSGYNNMKAAIVASRTQLCNNPMLQNKSNVEKIHLCRSLRRSHRCEYYEKVKGSLNEEEFKEPIIDIEDLVKAGTKFQCCPYYASKNLIHNAEIIFMPYNYLLDPKIRCTIQIDLQNSIVILDEAHNVEKVCEETACTNIRSSEISTAIADLKYVIFECILLSAGRFLKKLLSQSF